MESPNATPARPELNPSFVAWTVLRDLRDANQKIASQADLLMTAIEKDPSIDAAMCITMGIRPKVPPANNAGQPTGFGVDPQRK